MRFARVMGLLATLSMVQFAMESGGVECSRASRAFDSAMTHDTDGGDCASTAAHSAHARHPSPDAPPRQGHTHGTTCCTPMICCSAALAFPAPTSSAGAAPPSTRIPDAFLDGVPAPHFPPDTPPPRA